MADIRFIDRTAEGKHHDRDRQEHATRVFALPRPPRMGVDGAGTVSVPVSASAEREVGSHK